MTQQVAGIKKTSEKISANIYVAHPSLGLSVFFLSFIYVAPEAAPRKGPDVILEPPTV